MQGVLSHARASMPVEFRCVPECAQCCIERVYYPSKKFGKIGVLILPEEKEKIQRMADNAGMKISIMPRIGISHANDPAAIMVLAYQMMGRRKDGDMCPFLDTESGAKSPHMGYPCRIYNDRPLACKAYPLNESRPITLDEKCKFCKECGTADKNLESEMESLLKIKDRMETYAPFVWRFATGVGESEGLLEPGWVKET